MLTSSDSSQAPTSSDTTVEPTAGPVPENDPIPTHTHAHTHSHTVPAEDLDPSRVAGHWLLARLGKRVLRPGGVETTNWVLDSIAPRSTDDIVELAPGMGATTKLLLAANPTSYTGVDRDPDAAGIVGDTMDGPNRRVINANASDTGLPDNCADVVMGEAYLTMQPDSLKHRVLTEVARILRPGGRFALHEVAFAPDDISDERRDAVAASLRSSIKVSVTPMTVKAWSDLLGEHGITVTGQHLTPLSLLEPRRLINDEGFGGAAKFMFNVARNPAARKRVVAMRRSMGSNAANLQAIGLVGRRADDD